MQAVGRLQLLSARLPQKFEPAAPCLYVCSSAKSRKTFNLATLQALLQAALALGAWTSCFLACRTVLSFASAVVVRLPCRLFSCIRIFRCECHQRAKLRGVYVQIRVLAYQQKKMETSGDITIISSQYIWFTRSCPYQQLIDSVQIVGKIWQGMR